MEYKLITRNATFDAVILAAGDFPKAEVPLGILRNTKPLIACDSALKEIVEYNKNGEQLAPAAVIGDGDSLSSLLKKQYANIWHQVNEQEYNDLTKATRFAIANYNLKSIAYVGATGKREDHTIGNISLMSFYHREFGIQPIMVTDYGWFTAASGESHFESFAGQQLSIFNVSCRSLTGNGFKWSPYTYSELWQGTLNEPSGNAFTLNGDGEYIVYQTFERKMKAE